jgi:hypothetical protein
MRCDGGAPQSSLRPVLANLAYHYKLKMSVLRALGHLLDHLANWFNVSLGDIPALSPAPAGPNPKPFDPIIQCVLGTHGNLNQDTCIRMYQLYVPMNLYILFSS